MPKKTTPTKSKPKTSSASNMEELLKKVGKLPQVRRGDIINGKVITLSKKEMLFDIGWKTSATLIAPETKELPTFIPYLKLGQTLPVRIVNVEARAGFPVVSLQNFFEKGKWQILEECFQKEELIKVKVLGSGKGGLFIEVMGIRGVIPKIQLTQEFLQHPNKLYRQKVEVKILEVDRNKNRLVVSQKAAALGITQEKLDKIFNKIKEGETYPARIIGFSDFGIFCEVEGIEGLIHISEISWKKVSDPRKYAKENEKIKVMVLQKNERDYKLTLSLKRLQKDPWYEIEKKYPKDKEIMGEVIRKEPYGYFVRLEPGVEGLIHNSKITSETEIKVGKKIQTYVERIDKKHRKMSLIPVNVGKPLLYR
jgi:small subunit ribosomal protein S1